MNIPIVYHPELSQVLTEFDLSAEESHHLVQVLRKKEGELISVRNGKGLECMANIQLANRKKTAVATSEFIQHKAKLYDLNLAVAPTKNSARMEWLVEKATELGVANLYFIQTENSVRDRLKLDRLERIALSANKQSQRVFYSNLFPLSSFSELIENTASSSKVVFAHCHEKLTRQHISHLKLKETSCTLFIGPEGDFSKQEVEVAMAKNFKTITLGKERLRTETAALVGLAQLKLVQET